ncbi:MAG: hypothetical protein IKW24_00030, partial [Clostridia bacterium]|nr:hypothetical protein [Clostridia bacterium]
MRRFLSIILLFALMTGTLAACNDQGSQQPTLPTETAESTEPEPSSEHTTSTTAPSESEAEPETQTQA